MQFNKRTVFGFFDGSKTFEVPVYQRAYSWRSPEWEIFFTDLLEQIQGKNNYFFGNVLLEIVEPDKKFDVIDGQQRLTTLSIFIRSVVDVLSERIKSGEQIEIDIQQKVSTFLKNAGTIKLKPVEYDRACFNALIVDGIEKFNASTPSQKNIQDAKDWFKKELSKLVSSEILKLLSKVESTTITSIELEGKKDAALMFELQNNRGKDLTNMEKLKSYFMYQMYVYSPPQDAEVNIEKIADLFKGIYILINDIEDLDEDSILIYHCNVYINGFSYRKIEDIKAVFNRSTDKINWIRAFVEELHFTFSSIKKLEQANYRHYHLMKQLKAPAFIYPFIIKGYKYFGEDENKMTELLKVLEVLAFRFNLIKSGADINSRLNSVLSQFTSSIVKLKVDLKVKFNQEYHWSDERYKNTLSGYMYRSGILNYLLWRYEASIQTKGYIVGSLKLEDEQIEHISPQTPPPGESFASGYELNNESAYSEDFVNEYLNSLGNLILISGNHNRVIGNKPFSDKLISYKLNPLLNQQGEIKNFISGTIENPVWNKIAIDKRHKVLTDFALRNWNYD